MTTARELLDLVTEYVTARAEAGDDPGRLQEIAQRFDVALGEVVIDRASIQNEA
jgi:hypothetical protein